MKVNKKTVGYIFVFFAFIHPASYVLGSTISFIWDVYSLCICVYGILWISYDYLKGLLSFDLKILLLSLSYIVCFTMSSLLNYNNSDVLGGLKNLIYVLGFLSFAIIGIRKHFLRYIKAFLIVGIPMMLINLYTFIAYNGVGLRTLQSSSGVRYSDNWVFLTHTNQSLFIMLPISIVLFLYIKKNDKIQRIIYIMMLGFSAFCFNFQHSIAGFASYLLFSIMIIILSVCKEKSRTRIISIFSIEKVLIIFIIANILLAVTGRLIRYSPFLTQYLGKTRSTNLRVLIWSRSVECIISNLLLGCGWEYQSMTVAKIGINHTHNFLLELLYRGGILGTILFIYPLFLMGTKKNRENSCHDENYPVLLCGFFCYMIAAVFDFYLYRYEILLIVLLIYYHDEWNKLLPKTKTMSKETKNFSHW